MKLRNFIYGATILIVYVRFFCLYVFRGGKMRGKFVYIHAIQFFVKVSLFGPRVYPRGSLVIALVRWSMVRWSVSWSVFKYLRDRSKDFSNFLREVSAP